MEEKSKSPGDPKTKRVLIVDDDADLRDLLVTVIKSEGFNVETAIHGLEALDKISSSWKPDLIMLDLMLPRLGGYEVIRKLQEGGTTRIPVLVMTGRYTDQKTFDMIKQEPNVAAFMEKPVHPSKLTKLLHSVLATKKAA